MTYRIVTGKFARDGGRRIVAALCCAGLGLVLAAAPPVRAQVPTDGLQVWLRASDLAGVADGAPVRSWEDASGNDRDAVNPSSVAPVMRHDAVNDLPALRFGGTTGFGSVGAHLDVPLPTGAAVTAFVVAANQRNPLGREAVDVVLASKRSGAAVGGAGGFGLATYNAYADPTFTYRTPVAEPAGTGASVHLRRNGSASTVLEHDAFVVLTYLGSGIVNAPGAGLTTRIGGFPGQTTGLYGRNDIAEVLVYDRRLTEAEVLAVEAYLAETYALPNAAEPVPAAHEKPYRGAEVRTSEAFTYGRFAVRMRSMQASGVLASFFTYAEGGASEWNEIDIEIMGRYADEVQYNAITPGPQHHVYRDRVGFNPHAGFHEYAFEWTPDYVAWFVDGVEAHRQTGAHVATLRRPQQLMMNVWQPAHLDWAGPFESADLPLCAEYDDVRYAAYTPGAGTVGTGGAFTPVWEEPFDVFDWRRWGKGTHTFENNNVRFAGSNAGVVDGRLVLCITRPDAVGLPTAVEDVVVPTAPGRADVFPNPAAGPVSFVYEMETAGAVTLTVFDAQGRRVAAVDEGWRAAGRHTARLDAGTLPAGLYLYRLRTGRTASTGRLVLVR